MIRRFSSCGLAFLLALLTLALPQLASADDASSKFESMLGLAKQGDVKAQFQVAQCYATGSGVAMDTLQAIAWFKKAASQGHTESEVMLGTFHELGLGIPVDFAESRRWYRLAAAKGATLAQYRLGGEYANARGVDLDPQQAARWFRRAANQGFAAAQLSLGKLYETGTGVPQSDLEAFIQYSLARDQHTLEKAGADEMTAGLERTQKKLSSEQLTSAAQKVAAANALIAVHPRKFGAPGLIGRSRGWWVWKKWNPETWEAEVTPDPPGEVIRVRVLPWATTYRHLAYGARFDQLVPGEKMNMFFDPDENHRRGYVVHFQDEISQMKGHGHYWKVISVANPSSFVAQVYAGDKPLEEKTHSFEIDPACQKWSGGKLVDTVSLKTDDHVYMTWVYRDDRRVALLLTDDTSLETLKELETKRINAEIAAEGMAGQLETVDKDQVQFMVYSSYWAQSNKLQPNQPVTIVTTGPGYRPADVRFAGKVVSQKNRGMYGSGVNDVMLQLTDSADAAKLSDLEGQVLRLIPGNLSN